MDEDNDDCSCDAGKGGIPGATYYLVETEVTVYLVVVLAGDDISWNQTLADLRQDGHKLLVSPGAYDESAIPPSELERFVYAGNRITP